MFDLTYIIIAAVVVPITTWAHSLYGPGKGTHQSPYSVAVGIGVLISFGAYISVLLMRPEAPAYLIPLHWPPPAQTLLELFFMFAAAGLYPMYSDIKRFSYFVQETVQENDDAREIIEIMKPGDSR